MGNMHLKKILTDVMAVNKAYSIQIVKFNDLQFAYNARQKKFLEGKLAVLLMRFKNFF